MLTAIVFVCLTYDACIFLRSNSNSERTLHENHIKTKFVNFGHVLVTSLEPTCFRRGHRAPCTEGQQTPRAYSCQTGRWSGHKAAPSAATPAAWGTGGRREASWCSSRGGWRAAAAWTRPRHSYGQPDGGRAACKYSGCRVPVGWCHLKWVRSASYTTTNKPQMLPFQHIYVTTTDLCCWVGIVYLDTFN